MDIEERQRMERRRLKPGDLAAIIGRSGRIEVKKVTANFRVSVLVAGNVEYWVGTGNAISEYRVSRLRGLATPDDLDIVRRRIATKKGVSEDRYQGEHLVQHS